MSNAAVIQIIQINRATIGANNTSPFTVCLLNPDDYTDLSYIPGLTVAAFGGWARPDEDGAVEVAKAIADILQTNHIPYTVEWP